MLERYLLMSFFDEERRKRLLIIVLAPIIFFLVIFMSVAGLGTTAGTAASPLSREVEKWRPTVNKYCSQYKIGEYTDLALALMQAESGGCEDVYKRQILDVAKELNLPLERKRNTYKVSGYGGLYITPEKNAFNCFSANLGNANNYGGGPIQLVMFIQGCKMCIRDRTRRLKSTVKKR